MDAFRSEYSYDPATGRQSGVQSESRNYSLVTPLSASQAFDYTYLEGSDVAQSTVGWSLNGSGEWEPKLSTTRLYEAERDLVTEVVNSWGGSPAPISWHSYQNDALGRRTDRQDVGQIVTQNHFVYNDKSEVARAFMGNNVYSYGYDPIGNRRAAQVNGAATGYVPNKLNQYTGITGNLVSSPTYDADGNMLTCTLPAGDWTFIWDAENRLVSAVNGAVGVRNTYDHQSRRIRKEVFDFDAGVSEYVLRSDRVFVYDGWNLVSELVWTPAEQKWQRLLYTWGRDLSGTPQGAGGVGGLLAVTVFSEDAVAGCSGETYVPTYDANGNITAYYDLAGTVAARYDYDAFGNTVSGSVGAGVNLPFRFSTKYQDDETGLYYYGYRFYSPPQGRFINRDPIEEDGGINLSSFVGNSPSTMFDYLGLLGKVDVWKWQPLVEPGVRKWLVQVDWIAPAEWNGKKADCLPCKKVIWVQKIRKHRQLVGLPAYNEILWHVDWDAITYRFFGYAWTPGRRRASFSDSPGISVLKMLRPFTPSQVYMWEWFHYEIKSEAKCVSGKDSGQVYGTLNWDVYWGQQSDQVGAVYRISGDQ